MKTNPNSPEFPLPKLPKLPKGYVRWGKPRMGPLKGPIEMGSYHVYTYNHSGHFIRPRPLMGTSENVYIIAYRKPLRRRRA